MTGYSTSKRILQVLAENIPDDRIAESVPLVDHHAGYLLGKIKGAAA